MNHPSSHHRQRETPLLPGEDNFQRIVFELERQLQQEARGIIERGGANDFEEAYVAAQVLRGRQNGGPYSDTFFRLEFDRPNLLERIQGRLPVKVMKGKVADPDSQLEWQLVKRVNGIEEANSCIENTRRASDIVLGSPTASEEV